MNMKNQINDLVDPSYGFEILPSNIYSLFSIVFVFAISVAIIIYLSKKLNFNFF